MSRRFVYAKSNVYGWCVYDTKLGRLPAYRACCELLPPVKVDESGTVYESPVMLKSEYEAVKLRRKLEIAYHDYLATLH